VWLGCVNLSHLAPALAAAELSNGQRLLYLADTAATSNTLFYQMASDIGIIVGDGLHLQASLSALLTSTPV